MKISELGKTVTGKTPSTKNEKYFDGNILFITPTDITNGGYVEQTERHISEEGFNSIKTNTISGKSILVGCIGSDMGNVSWTDKTCASNQQINAITDIIDEINPIYIYYKLSQMKEYLRQLAGTTTTPILPKSIFDDIDLEIQDRNIQDKIVGILFNIDKKIENNNKINAELESMAKTIYDYWFLQFEFPNEEGKPYKSSGGKMVWNEELKREIPEGWNTTTIGDITICHDSERIPLSGKDRESMIGDIPYYGATDIMGYVNRPIFDGDYVLMAEDGSVMDEDGHPILQRVTGQVWVNNHAHVLEPIKKHSCKLLMMFLKDVYVPMIKTGSIQMKINQENMNGITVPNIPDDLKEKINLELCTIEKKQLQIIAENQELTSLRDFLLPMLMNGQVGFKINNRKE